MSLSDPKRLQRFRGPVGQVPDLGISESAAEEMGARECAVIGDGRIQQAAEEVRLEASGPVDALGVVSHPGTVATGLGPRMIGSLSLQLGHLGVPLWRPTVLSAFNPA